jgi:hypothetical protein
MRHLLQAEPSEKCIPSAREKAANTAEYPSHGEDSQDIGYRTDTRECFHNDV